MKKLLALVLVAAVVIFSAQVSLAASEKVVLTNQQEEMMRQNLTELGIDKPTQSKLIEKLNKGEIWDSMDPKKVEEAEGKLKVSIKEPVKRHTFPDGSVVQIQLSGGTSSCGTGYCVYRGVEVRKTDGSATGKFKADYTIISSGYDSISSVYDPEILILGGTYSNDSLVINIPQETVSYAAQATLKFTVSLNNTGTSTYYLKLYVGSNSAWQS